jgi:hypothetical protein
MMKVRRYETRKSEGSLLLIGWDEKAPIKATREIIALQVVTPDGHFFNSSTKILLQGYTQLSKSANYPTLHMRPSDRLVLSINRNRR